MLHKLLDAGEVFAIWVGVDLLIIWMWVCLGYVLRRRP